MDNRVWSMVNDTEQELLRAVEPKHLQTLDEDGLAALHDRIRRARTKYTKLYRQGAARQVATDAARAKASAKHRNAAIKAEAFEEALAVVSRELAKAAKAAAAALKAERIALARGEKAEAAAQRSAARAPRDTTRASATSRRTPTSTPAAKRSRGATTAGNARAQARRDAKR